MFLTCRVLFVGRKLLKRGEMTIIETLQKCHSHENGNPVFWTFFLVISFSTWLGIVYRIFSFMNKLFIVCDVIVVRMCRDFVRWKDWQTMTRPDETCTEDSLFSYPTASWFVDKPPQCVVGNPFPTIKQSGRDSWLLKLWQFGLYQHAPRGWAPVQYSSLDAIRV